MSPNYYKRLQAKRKERSRKGVLAREAKRFALAGFDRLVGRIYFDGKMFGGSHLIECYDIGDELRIAVKIDGYFHRPKSWRGLIRMLCRRIMKP